MNILIKLMSIVSLVIAPTLAQLHGTKVDNGNQGNNYHKIEKVNKQKLQDEAVVTYYKK